MTEPVKDNSSAVTTAHIAYLLYAIVIFVPFTSIAGIIISYIKIDDVRGTWLESHFQWQIQTFWKSLLWGVIGLILCVIAVGVIVIIAVFIWYLYRIIKGWIALSDNKPIVIPPKNKAK